MFKNVDPKDKDVSGNSIAKDVNDVIQVTAGINHSLALSESGKVYSWGYSGKNVLGRTRDMNTLALPVGTRIPKFDQKFKIE